MIIPDSKVHGANMGPIWGRQDPGGPHIGPMNFAIWDALDGIHIFLSKILLMSSWNTTLWSYRIVICFNFVWG